MYHLSAVVLDGNVASKNRLFRSVLASMRIYGLYLLKNPTQEQLFHSPSISKYSELDILCPIHPPSTHHVAARQDRVHHGRRQEPRCIGRFPACRRRRQHRHPLPRRLNHKGRRIIGIRPQAKIPQDHSPILLGRPDPSRQRQANLRQRPRRLRQA